MIVTYRKTKLKQSPRMGQPTTQLNVLQMQPPETGYKGFNQQTGEEGQSEDTRAKLELPWTSLNWSCWITGTSAASGGYNHDSYYIPPAFVRPCMGIPWGSPKQGAGRALWLDREQRRKIPPFLSSPMASECWSNQPLWVLNLWGTTGDTPIFLPPISW